MCWLIWWRLMWFVILIRMPSHGTTVLGCGCHGLTALAPKSGWVAPFAGMLFRQAAARSKLKAKLMQEGLRAKHDMLAAQRAEVTKQMRHLRGAIRQLEEDNQSLEAAVKVCGGTHRRCMRECFLSRLDLSQKLGGGMT